MIRIAVSQQTTFRAQYRSSERDADATFAADDRAFVVQTAISPKDKYRHSTVAELEARAAEDASYVISQQRGVDRGTERTARQVDQKRGERRQRHRLEDVLTSSLS